MGPFASGKIRIRTQKYEFRPDSQNKNPFFHFETPAQTRFAQIDSLFYAPASQEKQPHRNFPQQLTDPIARFFFGKLANWKKFTTFAPLKHLITNKTNEMKKGIHPENYRLVAFKDMSNDHVFLCRSAVSTKETIEVNGETYPVYKMEISNTSHPFYTGKMKLVDTAGRVDKFMSRYAKRYDQKGAK